MTILSILVPAHIERDVTRQLARLAKHAGVEWTRISGETTLLVPDPDHQGRRIARTCARFEVGALPKGDGWTFVARIQHTEAGNVIACAPGETLDPVWRDSAPVCEHCRTERRRADTFIVRSPDGSTLAQIGRNCLADFCALDAADMVARAEYCDMLTDFYPPADEDSWGRGGAYEPETVSVLAFACASIRIEGFAKGGITRGRVEFAMASAPDHGVQREEWLALQPTADDAAEAREVAIWASTDDAFAASDYGHNVRISCACLGCDAKRIGLVVSAPAAYHRAIGYAAQKRATDEAPDGGHWGAIGKRATVRATLTRVSYTEGAYGTIAICAFRTESGSDLVWFASGSHPAATEIGVAFDVKATPKRHETRNGRAQTVVSRAVCTEMA